MTEKPTTERVQEAIDEHRALLWQQYQKLSKLLRMIEGELKKLDDLSGAVIPRQERRIVDHIVEYLETKQHALKEDDIVEAMHKAGAGAGRRDSLKQIRDSISANLAPRHRNPKLMRVGKLVGLKGWGEEKFR